MAEWLRRQIRITEYICFPLGAQVQILLVSTFFKFFSCLTFTGNIIILAYRCWQFYCTLSGIVTPFKFVLRAQGAHEAP
jgi:hypothetical protein